MVSLEEILQRSAQLNKGRMQTCYSKTKDLELAGLRGGCNGEFLGNRWFAVHLKAKIKIFKNELVFICGAGRQYWHNTFSC